MVISSPHFYNASPDYQSYVQGLNPEKKKHDTFIYIEPVSTQTSVQVGRACVHSETEQGCPPLDY
jgi:hypothetical protein